MPALSSTMERAPASALNPFPGLPVVPVERRPDLDRASFEDFTRGTGRPVILTDLMNGWTARRKWSFDFLAANYGSERVIASPNLISYENSRRVRLSDFLLYCQAPALSSLNALACETPYYVTSPIRRHFPELANDFCLPAYMENCYDQLTGEMHTWYQDTFVWLYIGPKNTVTPLHVDHFMTHTLSAQIAGRKKFLLISPDLAGRIPGTEKTVRDIFRPSGPNQEAPAVIHEAVVSEGEALLFPAGWGHYVVSLEPSISLSINFASPSNFMSHLMMISRQLPAWGLKLNSAKLRAANDCQWAAANFATLNPPSC